MLNVQLQNFASHFERLVVLFVVAFGSQIAVGGQSVDLSTAGGRSAALTAVVSVVYFALRESTSWGPTDSAPTPPTSVPPAQL